MSKKVLLVGLTRDNAIPDIKKYQEGFVGCEFENVKSLDAFQNWQLSSGSVDEIWVSMNMPMIEEGTCIPGISAGHEAFLWTSRMKDEKKIKEFRVFGSFPD